MFNKSSIYKGFSNFKHLTMFYVSLNTCFFFT